MVKTKSDTHDNEAVSRFDERVRLFKEAFAREHTDVRDKIVQDLPAYNLLLSMGSESFEDIALHLTARNRGQQYNAEDPPIPDCPSCGESKSVKKRKQNVYRCSKCKEMFAANYNSISSGTKCDALTWAKLIQCMFSFYGQTRTCEYCGISPETYFSLRNRVFYAMQILMEKVKLSGEIQVDNTFVRCSYKGITLQAHDYSEDQIFYDDVFIPRPARSRGGHYAMEERNANSICIFTAIDDRSHVLACFAGVGATNYRTLATYVPEGKFLLEVPREDAFAKYAKEGAAGPKTKPGDKSIMIADKEGAIKRYANSIGLAFESHVYRRNNVQLKLSAGSSNIQRVNALHRRLKDYLRKTGYVSTKYLPGYLTMFEFIENIGTSQSAIQQLMELLATPKLGRSPAYYQEQFSVPNYLLEWLEDENALKKIPYNKLLAFYLYDHIRNKHRYPGEEITMKYIESETQYTAPSIRKIYRDLQNAGYRQKILQYFGAPVYSDEWADVECEITEYHPPVRKEPKMDLQNRSKTFNPVVLAIYDEYAQSRLLPDGKRPTFLAFLDEINKRYGTSYKQGNLREKFRTIAKSGVRPPLPEFNRYDNSHGKWSTAHAGIVAIARALPVLEEYDRIVLSYREKGEPVPKNHYIFSILSEQFGMSFTTIQNYLSIARNYRKKNTAK